MHVAGFDLLDDCRSSTRAVQYALDYVDLYNDCEPPDNSTSQLRLGKCQPPDNSTSQLRLGKCHCQPPDNSISQIRLDKCQSVTQQFELSTQIG